MQQCLHRVGASIAYRIVPVVVLGAMGLIVPRTAEYNGRSVKTFLCAVQTVAWSFTEVMQIFFLWMSHIDTLAMKRGWEPLPLMS